ncbi:MAG TPA: 3-dehydroquinate synthase [Anaerolineales bacterium]|jgi:3-dehydroquinate synthase
MHIFLYGPPGSGKTTTGRRVANELDLPFLDLDQVIEAGAGRSIQQLMAEHGEGYFRDLETAALHKVAQEQESVVALGGGTLLRDENRALAEGNGTVICLTAPINTLVARLSASARLRPLLAGDLKANLESLMQARAGHYASFPLGLSGEGQLDEVACQLRILAGRFHLSAMGSCDVIVQTGGLSRACELLQVRGLQNPLVVTDENIARHQLPPLLDSLQRSGNKIAVVTIPAGESAKNLETVSRLWAGFLQAGLDRRSAVLALGGGVVSDLAGFAASTFMRGIPWVAVPTTLLSMIDASLGGKTGFDLPAGKNLIGSFHSPRLVLADPNVLSTLPRADFRSGLAEVLKHGLIADPMLFELCSRGIEAVKANLEEIIRRAIAVKVNVVERDPYEQGPRAALNVGHTVGHAVELVSGFRLRHGEAVAIGMVIEARLAEQLKIAGAGLSDAITEALRALELPVSIPADLPRADLIQAMRMDKKKAGSVVRFALPVEIGKVQVGVEVPDLEMVFKEI